VGVCVCGFCNGCAQGFTSCRCYCCGKINAVVKKRIKVVRENIMGSSSSSGAATGAAACSGGGSRGEGKTKSAAATRGR